MLHGCRVLLFSGNHYLLLFCIFAFFSESTVDPCPTFPSCLAIVSSLSRTFPETSLVFVEEGWSSRPPSSFPDSGHRYADQLVWRDVSVFLSAPSRFSGARERQRRSRPEDRTHLSHQALTSGERGKGKGGGGEGGRTSRSDFPSSLQEQNCLEVKGGRGREGL